MKTILALSVLYFLRDIFTFAPLYVRYWLLMLMIGLFIAPMFFIDQVTAQLMMGGFVIGGMILGWMHMKMGITRLMGLAHVVWAVPMYFIYADLLSGAFTGDYQLWLGTAAFLSTLSVIIDVVDVLSLPGRQPQPNGPSSALT